MVGPVGHVPVLVQAVVDLLKPHGRRTLLDCTIGHGGHAEALLESAGEQAHLLGVDFDEANLRVARQRLGRFGSRVRLFRANFAEAGEVLREAGVPAVDLLLADLGVCSSQLDDPGRGLSFMVDGPLDMRLDDRSGRTASDLVGSLGEKELADLIYAHGEERYSRRIARAIVAARKQERIVRTRQLAEVVASAYPPAARRSRRGVHPATRTFQALRIAVNAEMDNLDRLMDCLPAVLAPGARAGIISFHSLEDRLVKQAFLEMARNGTGEVLTRKPILPSEAEMASNPRSRSAKLRGIERRS